MMRTQVAHGVQAVGGSDVAPTEMVTPTRAEVWDAVRKRTSCASRANDDVKKLRHVQTHVIWFSSFIPTFLVNPLLCVVQDYPAMFSAVLSSSAPTRPSSPLAFT
jgi:hypothetical protein